MTATVHPALSGIPFGAALHREVRRAMEIILHLGAHRTATTTFQSFLDRNSTALAMNGTAVWTPSRTRDGLFSGLFHRPDAVTAAVARRAERSRGRVRMERSRLRSFGMQSLVISDENLIGSLRHNLRTGVLYDDMLARLVRFRSSLGAQCTRVGIAVRSYDSYWASALAYGVDHGFGLPSADRIAALSQPVRRWTDVVRDAARAFPGAEIAVWPFEEMAARPDAQLDILTGRAVAGLEGDDAVHNASARLPVLRRRLVDADDLPAAARLGQGNGRFSPFDEVTAQTMADIYARDLEWLRDGADGLARFYEQPPVQEAAPQTEMTLSGFGMALQPCLSQPPTRGLTHGRQRYLV